MSWGDALKLPLKVFWMLNKQVGRLRAEADLRMLKLLQVAQAPDVAKTVHGELVREVGQTVKETSNKAAKVDVEGFTELMKFDQVNRVGSTNK
jgi:hypothetical protein